MRKTAIIFLTVLFALAASWALADEVRKKKDFVRQLLS